MRNYGTQWEKLQEKLRATCPEVFPIVCHLWGNNSYSPRPGSDRVGALSPPFCLS
eukprot:SAG22_NODE_21950_length_252_cov_1.346405_1_plen_54_part_10